MSHHQNRRVWIGAAVAVGLAGAALAGLDQLMFVCDNCAQGPNDTECVHGDPVECRADQGCVTQAEDTDGDGKVDEVINICLDRRP